MLPTVLRVALPLPLPTLFDFLPAKDDDLIEAIGTRVRVPFRRGVQIGLVVEVGPAESDLARLRPIFERLDARPLMVGELLQTLQRAARYYHAPIGELIAAALPLPLRRGDDLPSTRPRAWRLCAQPLVEQARLKAGGKPARLVARLAQGAASETELALAVPESSAALRALQQRRLIEAVEVPSRWLSPAGVAGPELHAEQQQAAAAICDALGSFKPLLLEGVTGSGKTEVYLTAIRRCLELGRQALVLIPEIGLTPQLLHRFQQRLGLPVHCLHSDLADGERARVWTAMHRGEAQVLIGTRSAVFSPLPNAGLIVVDEEHDASFKQQDGVRYSARDLALLRAQALAVPVVLGSATPSLETLAAAQAGRYQHLRLSHRAGGAKPPSVRVVDLRGQTLRAGLSQELLDAVGRCLARDEQALIFRNRRGYAPVLLCHDCGWSAQCQRCDSALTAHQRGRALVCHHCGARARAPNACPDCSSLALQPQGVGTERLEETLAEMFPDVPCIRVDRETTRGRSGLEKQLKRLGNAPGILVGTQMLAKGHDLPRLGLVGVVGVDEGLHSVDFRAAERLAQLLIQVGGRAGRAQTPGSVLLQTHHPQHPLLITLLGGGYPAFAAVELDERRAAALPPFGHLALLRAEAVEEAPLRDFLAAARGLAEARMVDGSTVALMGPLAAPMQKRAGRQRWQLLLSADRRPALQNLLAVWVPELYRLPEARRVRWSLDVDPVDLY